jgi:hypothetical protein
MRQNTDHKYVKMNKENPTELRTHSLDLLRLRRGFSTGTRTPCKDIRLSFNLLFVTFQERVMLIIHEPPFNFCYFDLLGICEALWFA